MADLACPGIRSAIDTVSATSVENQPGPNAGRQGQVEERAEALPRAEGGLAQGAHVGVVIHDDADAEQVADVLGKRKILPAAHLRRERDRLTREIHRTAQPDSAPAV